MMKDNKDEKQINKEEIINGKKEDKNNLFYKGPKAPVSSNYIIHVKQKKSRNRQEANSFFSEIDKKNKTLTMKTGKKLLNKTLDINNNNTIKNNNQNKAFGRTSLYLNHKNVNNNTINNSKNNFVRKTMIIIKKNNDNKSKKLPDKRASLPLHKYRTSIINNKNKSNTILEEIIEKNEDKKNIDNKENNRGIKKDIKNKNDFKRAYSRKQTEKDRQKKLNKLNEKDFGAVEKYTKKAMPFLKREPKDINNNILYTTKYGNQRLFKTKTNYNLVKNSNKIVNNIIDKNQNLWSNKELPRIKNNIKKSNFNKIYSNLYDKYNNNTKNDNKILPKYKNDNISKRPNNPIYKTISTFNNILNKNKSSIKLKEKNVNQKPEFNNKKNIHIRAGSMRIISINKRKNASKINNFNIKNEKNKNKKVNKTLIKYNKTEKERGKKDISKKKNKNNIKQKKIEDDSSSDDDEEDENDFDIYAMIRSKSCYKKKTETKNLENEKSEKSEEKKVDSEDECDIESILYGKQPKKILNNIYDDNCDDRNTIIKYIDFNEVFLTSNNIFTENIEKNNLYSKYIPKFDEIYNKHLLKIKENKKLN